MAKRRYTVMCRMNSIPVDYSNGSFLHARNAVIRYMDSAGSRNIKVWIVDRETGHEVQRELLDLFPEFKAKVAELVLLGRI